MRFSLLDLPALLRSPLGRGEVRAGLLKASFPFLQRAALAHRLTLARGTRLVAVTGSFGKSTTVRAVGAALGVEQPRWGANRRPYVLRSVLQIRPGQPRTVIEVAIAEPGDMAAVASIVRPDVAVVTSIGSEHHTSLGRLEVTRAEKVKLVQALRAGGVAVLNGDDPHVRWMAEQTAARVVTFGFLPGNDVRASELSLDWPHGTRFTLEIGSERRAARVRLLGRHQVYAALAALAVARVEGVGVGAALDRLELLEPTAGRLEPVRLPSGAIVLRDEYKSSFETIEAALALFREVPAARRLLVLGEIQEPPAPVGDSYRRIGELAAGAVSRVVLIGSRDVRRYRTGLKRGGLAPEAVSWVQDLRAAAEALRRELRSGDVVLLKGTVTQRLERVLLDLEGRTVGCALPRCPATRNTCRSCVMLERGWEGVPMPIPRPRRAWIAGSPGRLGRGGAR